MEKKLDKQKLNSWRRCAGIPQDFSADPRPITEDRVPGISQILRGNKGDQLFYLICGADKEDDLADVMTEVDFPALANIIKKANNTAQWELFPHSQQNEALNLARKRLAMVTEMVGVGASSRAMDNVPAFGSEEDIEALELEEVDVDEEFEPATNICPDCEGGEHPPTIGKCERCDGHGEVFEAKKETKPDFADVDKDGDKKESAKKAAKDAKEEQEEASVCDKCDKDPCTCEEQEEYEEVKEGAHYHADDSYPLTHKDNDLPHNVDASGETIWDKPAEIKDDHLPVNDTTKIKVPSKILSELKRVIDETKAEAEKAKPRDFDRAHYYEDTAEALQIVHDYLSEKTVDGLKRAQYYVHRMMNISRALIPDTVWKFIVNGGVSRSLKSYVNDVKEPTTGKPFSGLGIVNVETLNKNTHTE